MLKNRNGISVIIIVAARSTLGLAATMIQVIVENTGSFVSFLTRKNRRNIEAMNIAPLTHFTAIIPPPHIRTAAIMHGKMGGDEVMYGASDFH